MMERLKKAVPDLIIQVGGSIAFEHPKDDGQVGWLSYDTRHMLAEITPKPETVTVAIGTSMMDLTQMWTPDDIRGTHLEREPKAMAAWAGMYTDAGPAFYLEHLKRLRKSGIQPYFTLAHVHQLEIVERLIRHGAYMGPLNTNITTYGGGGCGHNPYDWMHWLQRQPQGAIVTFWAAMRVAAVAQPLALIMGQHCRVGIEDNIWNSKRERMTTIEQIKAIVSLADRFGRKIATAKEAREIMKIGVWYNSVDETLKNLGMPPNRGDDDRGFMVWETDGKKAVQHAMSDSHPMAYCMTCHLSRRARRSRRSTWVPSSDSRTGPALCVVQRGRRAIAQVRRPCNGSPQYSSNRSLGRPGARHVSRMGTVLGRSMPQDVRGAVEQRCTATQGCGAHQPCGECGVHEPECRRNPPSHSRRTRGRCDPRRDPDGPQDRVSAIDPHGQPWCTNSVWKKPRRPV